MGKFKDRILHILNQRLKKHKKLSINFKGKECYDVGRKQKGLKHLHTFSIKDGDIVYYDAAQEFANLNGLFFFETSAVADINVKEAFERLLHEIYDQGTRSGHTNEAVTDGLRIGGLPEGEKPTSSCC
eukprot:s2017_g3.t1